MKLLITITVFLLITTWGKTQTPLKHEKKVYRAPDGKLFIQKSLPVYLRIATSPDENVKSYLLESEQSKKYTNPMFFDTEGYNTVRSPSAVDTLSHKVIYPLNDIIFEVYTDSKPPVTKLDFSKATLYSKNGQSYFKGGTEIAFSSNDEGSGTEKTYFAINGSAFQEYAKPLTFNEEKNYTIKFYSVDNVGNAEDIKEKSISIDLKNPETSFEVKGPKHENVLSFKSSFVLSASDNIAGVAKIMYKIDQNPVKKYYRPIKMVGTSQGEHILTYYSEDQVGNIEQEKQYVFYIDNTPPILIEELVGNTIDINGVEFTSGRTKLKLTAKDNKAGVKAVYYSINGAAYQLYEKPFYLSETSGKLLIKIYAVDHVENKSNSSKVNEKTGIPYFDLSGPLLSHQLKGSSFKHHDTIYITSNTKIILSAKDREAGTGRIEYTIDNKKMKEFNEPFTIKEEGFHQVSYTGYDKVENSNIKTINFIVDNTGPETNYQFSTVPVKSTIYPAHMVLFFSATDKSVGFGKMFYSINGSPEILYARPLQKFIKGNDYHVKIRVQDKLGNQSFEEVKFSIEN